MYKPLKPYVTPIILLIGSWVLNMATPDLPVLFGIIIGLGTFWLALAIFSNKALLKNHPWILEWVPFLDPTGGFANAQQLTGRFIQDQTFQISMVAHDGVITGRTFDDCDIYGPAIIHMHAGGVGQVVSCAFDGSAQNSLIVAQTLPNGAIIAIDCNFRNCRFHRISFIGSQQQMENYLRGFLNTPGRDAQQQAQQPSGPQSTGDNPATA